MYFLYLLLPTLPHTTVDRIHAAFNERAILKKTFFFLTQQNLVGTLWLSSFSHS